jgi:hypothetical protein
VHAAGFGIGLAEARRRVERLRQNIGDGKDPAEERAAAKQRDRGAVRGLGTLRGERRDPAQGPYARV